MPISAEKARQEAIASVTVGEIIYSTLEFHHPDIVDDETGTVIALRIVQDSVDHEMRLESTAPKNAGELVTWKRMGFSLVPPSVEEGVKPVMKLRIENVSRYIMEHLDGVEISQKPIEVYYREYSESHKTEAPNNVVNLPFTITSLEITSQEVTASCEMPNFESKKFPALQSAKEIFPTL